MKRQSPTLLLFLCLVVMSTACRKKAPDDFSADFNVNFNNGGMAPDMIQLAALFPDADTYEWTVEGVSLSGKNAAFNFQTSGTYYVSLEVESGKHKEMKGINVTVENYPVNGSAMTIVQGDGVIGSYGVDGDAPFFIPIDTIDAISGMDYDDDTKEIYYAGSIIRAFPNGAGKQVIFTDDQFMNGEKIIDLVFDNADKRIYFAASGEDFQSVGSVDQNGNDLNYEFQFTFFSPIIDITLDEANDNVYLTTEFSGAIYKTIFGDLATVYEDENQKYALVFDNSNGYLYFAEEVFDQSGAVQSNIMRFKPNEYNFDIPETWPQFVVENASLKPVLGLDISESKQQLYWSDSGENIIYRLDLNDSKAEREIIFTNVENPRALAIGDF